MNHRSIAYRFAVASLLAWILFAVGACANYNTYADKVADYACSAEGQTWRAAYRAARDGEFRTKDRAACGRCPGETELKCTGDPIALPGGGS